MTEPRTIERLLDDWFSEGPAHAPDRVVDAIVDRIERQGQRPAWRLTWRLLPMTTTLRVGAGLAAIAAVAVLASSLMPAGPPTVGANPTISPTAGATSEPTAPRDPSCENGIPGCAGALSAGLHRSARFQPALSVEVPGGWENTLDVDSTYVLWPIVSGGRMIRVWSNVSLPDEVGSCDPAPAPGAATVDDWIEFIEAHPGLIASEPRPVAIGGWDGQSIEVAVKSDWPLMCPDLPGPIVQFILNKSTAGDSVWGVLFGDRALLHLLDVGGRVVIVHTTGPMVARGYEAMFRAVQPIIDSMEFEAGG